jgi:hypothetical protein
MAFATVFGGKPRFPLIEPPLETASIAQYCQDELILLEPYILASIPSFDSLGISTRLRILSRTMERGKLSKDDAVFLATGISRTHYHIVSTLGDLEDMNTGPPSRFELRAQHLAALLYIDLALREILPTATMHYVMVKRLKIILEEGANNILMRWDDSLEQLLWIAFIGAAAADVWPEKAFFIRVLAQAKDAMMISSFNQFQNILKGFGWLRSFNEAHSLASWTEIDTSPSYRLIEDSNTRAFQLPNR